MNKRSCLFDRVYFVLVLFCFSDHTEDEDIPAVNISTAPWPMRLEAAAIPLIIDQVFNPFGSSEVEFIDI